MILALEQTLFRRRLWSTIALQIVLLLLLSGISIWQITRLLSVLRWVDHSDQVISQANYTQKLLLDRETGLRGYLLTGKQNFLAPYEQANAVIDANLEDLKRLVADNKSQVRRVTALIAQSNQWEQQAPPAITRRQRGEREPSSKLELRKQLMDEMRQQIDRFIATEEQLRNQRSQAAQQTTTNVILTSLLLALGVGAVLAYFLHRQILQVSQIYEGALHTARAKTQQAEQLAQALQQYKDIFEFAEYGLVVGTPDNQTLALMNPAFARMHGYTVEELVGTPILNVFPSECHAEAIEFITHVNERGYDSIESQHCRKDGTVFPVFLSGTAVRDVEGNLLYRIVTVYRECAHATAANRSSSTSICRNVRARDPNGEGYRWKQSNWRIVSSNRHSINHCGFCPYSKFIRRDSLCREPCHRRSPSTCTSAVASARFSQLPLYTLTGRKHASWRTQPGIN
jgi:PAS domain S-box-containing protein